MGRSRGLHLLIRKVPLHTRSWKTQPYYFIPDVMHFRTGPYYVFYGYARAGSTTSPADGDPACNKFVFVPFKNEIKGIVIIHPAI